MFSKNNSQFLLTELFPLPKKNYKHWSDKYGEHFGFSSSDKKKYINAVREHRFNMLRDLWKEKRPALTLCFGKRLGAEISQGNGSRIRIYLNGVRAVFHRPHPRKETDKCALKSMRRFLIEAGVKSVKI